MAYIEKTGSKNHHIFRLTVWESNVNNAENKSDASFTFTLRPKDSGVWDWSGYGENNATYVKYELSVAGKNYSGYIPSYDGKSTVTLKSGAVTVQHDNDGEKTINYSFKITDTSSASYTPGNAEASDTLALTTIPRASSIDSLTCATSYLNGTMTYKYTPKSASYYNRINISNNINGTYIRVRSIDLGKKATSQQTGTVTLTAAELEAIYADLPNTEKGKIRFTLRTYSDSGYSNQIGSAAYKEVELTIPASVKPEASLTVTRGNANAWIKGKNIYVAGYSTAALSLSSTPGFGASLSSVSISGDGWSQRTASLTLQLNAPGEFTFTGGATDSRGRYATNAKTITVLSYSAPTLATLQFQRGTYASGAWTAKNDGPDIKVTFKAGLALSDNGNRYAAAFKLNGSTVTPTAGSASNLVSGTEYAVYLAAVSTNRSHLLEIQITDSVGESGGGKLLVPSSTVTMAFNKKTGKGAAIGKTSEKDAFECALPAEFSKSVTLIREDGSTMEIGDTGWISLGVSDALSLTSATDTGRNGPGCFYRVVNGNHVYVAFNVPFAFSGDAVTINGGKIPSALRPKRKAYAMNVVSGRSFARVGVNTSGNVIVDWIQDVDSSAETTSASTTWIDGYIDYWLD